MNWSFQLYSARNYQPWDKILKMLGSLDYTQVEGFGGVYDDPKAFRAEMDKNGLTMPTAHFSLDMLENDFDGVRRIAETMGTTVLICPHIAADARPSDAAGWKAFGERLGMVGEKASNEGYDFAWHNHDFEFTKLPDGSLPLDHILTSAPNVGLEFDVAWCIRGGDVPWPIIERYGRRIIAVHVKDIAKAGKGLDEDGWSDVGDGTIEWPKLMSELRTNSTARYYVMEQDNPNDIERFARRSIEAANVF